MHCHGSIGVVGADASLLELAAGRLAELEARWSRFIDDSELSRLNRALGCAQRVSRDTLDLFAAMQTAWVGTGGRFDPTVLAAVQAAGYDRSFEQLGPLERAGATAGGVAPAPGLATLRIDRDRSSVVCDVAVDPGAIGKGLAADLVYAELRAAGAAGALLELGGDVRVGGVAPSSDGWVIAVEHTLDPDGPPLTRFRLQDGAIATSSTLLRRLPGGHHVIDPSTGRPTTHQAAAATVVGGSCWWAEALATAVLVADDVDVAADHPVWLVGRDGSIQVGTVPEGLEAVA